ncbi:MAG TPA: prenyltransferase/squalene oxidase repeat-containing protein [Gemmataceae bacterium]
MRPILTAALFAALVPPALGQTPQERAATVRYLQKLQRPDGGFLPAAADPRLDVVPQSSLRATSAALRALKYFGGKVPDATAAAQFVRACYVPETGAFADRPGGREEVFATAVGLMAAKELSLPLEPYREKSVAFLVENAKSFEDVRIAVAGLEALGEPRKLLGDEQAERWRKVLPELRGADGAFRKDARLLGSAVAALYRLGFELDGPEAVKACAAAMRADRRDDGAFGEQKAKTSDLGTTYRVVRSFVRLGESPGEVEKLRAFVENCRNADGGYGNRPGEPSGVGPTYYAGILLHWLGR